ncbi:Peptidase M1 N-terminal domain/Peptidase family M1 domain/ERAP1-like C-terminal domain containing protein, putative [Angomonas deanei]|uniref:Aminopeptidase n=1 Tax=Angomonas deanei TaxID=59799 RepID=A0A7G2CI74_9TRYP|nr:Peptidase M1 N-terminal domain/Peptidase family M1 domain/ERAP1-like C-terminal domain containing protein, putative [Angomonas deanei]
MATPFPTCITIIWRSCSSPCISPRVSLLSVVFFRRCRIVLSLFIAKMKSVKLSNAFVPSAYHLVVTVDLSTWSYEVEEKVTLKRNAAVELSKEIQLHAASSMKIGDVRGGQILGRDEELQTVVLSLDQTDQDETEVTFHFKHEIQEELRGFYRVRFQHNGVEHRMASTHFEPTAARRFYICQDEPAARADFTLTVRLPKEESHYTVLSNGPLREKTVTDQFAVYQFDTIPSCPPYLTACVVGELEHVETVTNGIPIRVYTALGKSSKADFALKTTAFALNLFEQFFQAKFPLPKLDVVAVPDFPIGGMENWGCIACIDSILVDPATSSIASQKRASELICHEVSHNWFGNLVAISWWEGLWLKEGFASWCGYYASHLYEESWKCMDDAAGDVGGALETDMYENSHPVEVRIDDPAQITEIFDSISYDKGMGLVFMLEAFLGDRWSSAVAHYIKTYQYKDTRTVQLWEALQEASGLPISASMQSFTTQMGYPILHIKRLSPSRLSVRQQPCKLASTPQKSTQTWSVPLTIQSHGDTRIEKMVQGTEELEVDLPEEMAKQAFLTANPARKGFYRCRYDDDIFNGWLQDFTQLQASDKCAMVSDIGACIKMGLDDMTRLSAFGAKIRESERDTGVLRQYSDCVKQLSHAFTNEEVRSWFRREHLAFFVQLADECLHDDKASMLHKTFLINTALQYMAADYDVEEAEKTAVLKWSLEQVKSFLSDGAYDPGTLAACCIAYVRFDKTKEIEEKNEQLFDRYGKVDGNDELCRSLLQGMLSGSDTAFVKQLCLRCIENNGVRNHFGGTVFMGMCANPFFKGTEIWDFFQSNFKSIERQWGGGQFRIQVIVSQVAGTLHGPAAAAEYGQFFKQNPLPNARLAIGRSVENIQLRSWIENKWTSVLKTLLK